ncbi:maleylpyruvate isomerase family mycothiol-dependent enzyme [Nocardioides sp.]|uniref:maleylpyruvate isomerase family mycothiol-dependent enzyme n=1 Tax=Nocardioides sp. TaxID=35761 RepID=UPI0035190992
MDDAHDVDDAARLAGYIETWWSSVTDLTALLDELDEQDWTRPTDLAGWTVHDVAAHIAHLEKVLAGDGEEHAEIGDPPPAHVTSLFAHYTEIGVVNRRTHAPGAVVAEIRDATARRRAQLLADPPTDPAGAPAIVPGGVPWTWNTLLRNRPLDVWMHEQDVRRAVGRPGGLHTPGADHTVSYLAESFGYVVAKKAGAPAGTTAVLVVVGEDPVGVTVTEDGKGRRLDALPGRPTVVLEMDRETFIRLAGGRGSTAHELVRLEGDHELGQRIVAAMATTP